MKINYNCRYFKGDRPCRPHKKEGVHCDGCRYYDPAKERILIIKLDAAGDVLRTTSILPGLKEKYPKAQITWMTKAESMPLFQGNPYVDRVYDVNNAAVALSNDEFDIVINLDTAPLSSMLAASAKGEIKIGYGYNRKGHVYPFNREAEEWLLMSIFDDIKKVNDKTYQSIILEICSLAPSDYPIQYFLTSEETDISNKFAEQAGIKNGDIVIGLNTGAGRRWEKKKWTEEGFVGLIHLIKKRHPAWKILLYGGPEEVERNRSIISKTGKWVMNAGCNNSIRGFAALLNLSTVVVTGDTLALHLAVALQKKVVAMIGPTSAAEIEIYGRGIKITPDVSCLCCYREKCGITPDCMGLITAEDVFSALQRLVI